MMFSMSGRQRLTLISLRDTRFDEFVFQPGDLVMSIPRRTFLMTVAVSAASGAGLITQAHAQAMLDEKDPQATALGYVADASKVDVKKYTKYAAGQNCTGCALYLGKASDKAGGCPLFAGKQVAGAGWCSAWAKKA